MVSQLKSFTAWNLVSNANDKSSWEMKTYIGSVVEQNVIALANILIYPRHVHP